MKYVFCKYDPEQRVRLLLISVLSIKILTLFGEVGEKLGMDRHLKANTIKHRTMSLFRQGCHYYNQIISMTKAEFKIFFDCFFELLKRHEK